MLRTNAAELALRFSALQRAEIAEITRGFGLPTPTFKSFSALQRAEIAEMQSRGDFGSKFRRFSALQRAEIAEICDPVCEGHR